MKPHTCVWRLVLLAFTSLVPVYAASAETPKLNREQLVGNYGKLPLSFEVNEGQTDPRVRFLSRGSGYGVFLTERGAVLAFENSMPRQGQHADISVLKMELIGANGSGAIRATNQLPGTSNYFVGNKPEHWHTSIPTYAAVKYESVYPGVDLVYHGKQRQLEYDFMLAARADPQPIQLRFRGAKRVRIDRSGELRITLRDSDLVMHAPVAYQESDGGRRLVDAGFVLYSRTRVGFRLGAYDRSRSLVIDPVLVYSTFLGGSGMDGGEGGGGMALDASGDAYITGGTTSPDLPLTPGAVQTTFRGSGCGVTGCSADAFVSKLNADGSALVYSTYLGGTDFADGVSIAVDASGNAYVTGLTNSSDFPTTPDGFQKTYHSNNGLCNGGICANAFVSKLNATGSALVYSTYLGGSVRDGGSGIAVDTSGNAYVTGNTVSFDFPTTPGAFRTTSDGGFYGGAFVSKLNAAGSGLDYSTHLGGSDSDAGYGIAVDTSGNAYITGWTISPDFPTTPGAFRTTYSGGSGAFEGDAFVSKLNAAGSALVYSTYLGGTGGDYGYGIAVDTSGNAYITGSTTSPDFPVTLGAFRTTSGGGADAFVSKLNAAGSTFFYSTYLGGGSDDGGTSIAIDSSGNAYVIGVTDSPNFPTTSGAFQPACGGARDAFVSRLGVAGSLVYSTYLGGNNDDEGLAIAVDTSGSAYVSGWTGSSNFPVTPHAFQPAFGGASDAFISKFSFGIPFSSFNARLELDVDDGAFRLKAKFKLGQGGSMNPLTDAVTLGIGPYSVTIPARSFKRHGEGYEFKGVIGRVRLEVSIRHGCREDSRDFDESEDPNGRGCEGNQAHYTLRAEGRRANLKGIANPVPVTVSIGNNNGNTDVTADFD